LDLAVSHFESDRSRYPIENKPLNCESKS
jgi:hypothetical protein